MNSEQVNSKHFKAVVSQPSTYASNLIHNLSSNK